ncbi:putative receptor-like protein kinase [Acorus gramineus]|uniref:Receptor-like protein kinase n=1 Tax=Acorus gramineus TaxID=55184 RepID=A0AAV9AB42_ACOGR|nr:putative receptor-like protein kinase [Acorus gramineus]
MFNPSLLILLLLPVFSSASPTPLDNYLLDCGSATSAATTATNDGRVFVSDATPTPNFTLSADPNLSVADPNPSPGTSNLHRTARIFTAPSSYVFNIKTNGTHVIRFHFHAFSSKDYNLPSAEFEVSAFGFPLFFINRDDSVRLKEYFIKLDRGNLMITFRPANRSTFAFVNAIEVFSAPDDLVADSAGSIGNPNSDVYNGLSTQVLETLYRINVGGPKITAFNDSLWRSWTPDGGYLKTPVSKARSLAFQGRIAYQSGGAGRDIAPDNVYATARHMNYSGGARASDFNLTFDFDVDRDSRHLVRLHFCDVVSSSLNQLYFDVYINGFSVVKDLDLSVLTFQTLASPYYVDFVVDSAPSARISVSVGPSDRSLPSNVDAILNGLEIMRLYDAFTLDAQRTRSSALLALLLGCVTFICLAMLMLGVILFKLNNKQGRRNSDEAANEIAVSAACTGSSSGRLSKAIEAPPAPNFDLARKISLADVLLATNNFHDDALIGSGGFGNVYKGVLKDGTTVAVKRGVPGSKQGLAEFRREIAVLSKIQHRHLVYLIGYCEERAEMILVYQFMSKGPLRDHLYGAQRRSSACLPWKRRVEICIGAARGLYYLHTGTAGEPIIHRDVKPTNILLDEDYKAKVADFGLSRCGPRVDQTHVSTGVKGSFGYLDPEYFKTQRLTEKSDVYSFGVVMLEVLCARPAIDGSLSWEEVNLAEWGMQWQKKGLLERIVDPRLKGTIDAESLRKFGETAEKCLAQQGTDRPTMGDVLWNLEGVLQMQVMAMKRERG